MSNRLPVGDGSAPVQPPMRPPSTLKKFQFVVTFHNKTAAGGELMAPDLNSAAMIALGQMSNVNLRVVAIQMQEQTGLIVPGMMPA